MMDLFNENHPEKLAIGKDSSGLRLFQQDSWHHTHRDNVPRLSNNPNDNANLTEISVLSPTGDEQLGEERISEDPDVETTIWKETASDAQHIGNEVSLPTGFQLEGIEHVPLGPPNLPPIFAVATGIDPLYVKQLDNDMEIVWLQIPDIYHDDHIPLDFLRICAHQIAILSPRWSLLHPRNRKAVLALDEQLNWFKSALINNTNPFKQLTELLRRVIARVPGLGHQKGITAKLLTTCQRFIIKWITERLEMIINLETNYACDAQPSPLETISPHLPAEVISVNLSQTPTLPFHDQSSRLSNSPVAKSPPTSRTWTPMATAPIQNLKPTRPQPVRSKSGQFLRSPGCCRSHLAPTTSVSHQISDRTLKSMQFSYPKRRSASHPEGLNQLRYYRLVFFPSECQMTSVRAQSTCEGRCHDDQAQTIPFTEDPCGYSQMPSLSFDVTGGSKFCQTRKGFSSNVQRDRLLSLILRSLLDDLDTNDACLSDEAIRGCVEGILEHAIAISLTHRMDEISETTSMDLSQMVYTAPVSVGRIMDALLLEAFANTDILAQSPQSPEIAGEGKVYVLATRLIQQIASRDSNKKFCEEKTSYFAKRFTQRLLQLAYPAACTALAELIKSTDLIKDEKCNFLTTYSSISSLSLFNAPQESKATTTNMNSKQLPLVFEALEITQREINSDFPVEPGECDTEISCTSPKNKSFTGIPDIESGTQVFRVTKLVRRHSLEERKTCFLVSQTKCSTPIVLTKTKDLTSSEKPEYRGSFIHSPKSDYPSESSSVTYEEVNSQEATTGDIQLTFSTSQDVHNSICLTAMQLKVVSKSWEAVPLPQATEDILCPGCSERIHSLINTLTQGRRLTESKRPASRKIPSVLGEVYSPREDFIRMDPPTLSHRMSGAQLEVDQDSTTSTELHTPFSASDDQEKCNPVRTTTRRTPALGEIEKQNHSDYLPRAAIHQAKSRTCTTQTLKRFNDPVRKSFVIRRPWRGDSAPADARRSLPHGRPRRPRTGTPGSAITRRSSVSMRSSLSEVNSSPVIYRTASSRTNSLPSMHSAVEVVTPMISAMDPFYSCLEEVKECLKKAESRLHAVNLLAAQKTNDSTSRVSETSTHHKFTVTSMSDSTRSTAPKRQGPCSTGSFITVKEGRRCPETRSYPLPTKTKTNLPDHYTGCSRRKPGPTSNFSRPRGMLCGPTHFPAPSMELPIRPHVFKIDGGIPGRLEFSKRLLPRLSIPNETAKMFHAPTVRFKGHSPYQATALPGTQNKTGRRRGILRS